MSTFDKKLTELKIQASGSEERFAIRDRSGLIVIPKWGAGGLWSKLENLTLELIGMATSKHKLRAVRTAMVRTKKTAEAFDIAVGNLELC